MLYIFAIVFLLSSKLLNKMNYKHQFSKVSLYFLLVVVLLFSGCATQRNLKTPEVKYVFFFIGDGMGLAHANATEAYLGATKGDTALYKLNLSKLPVQSFASTYAANRYITGSAAAGTALATGHKTSINTIGMAADKKTPLKTIAEKAHEAGFKVGIISNVQLNHATPASFYAHRPSRSDYFEIAMQLPESNFEFFGGGGIAKPIKKVDGTVVNAMENLRTKGYTFTNNRAAMQKLKKSDLPVFVTSPILEPGSRANRYVLDYDSTDLSQEEVLDKAIKLLDNDKGFFIMLEGGKIDWASHSNDGATMIHELLAFDEAIGCALLFYEKHPDETLILVTADHETGGLSVGNRSKQYDLNLELLQYQTVSAPMFSTILKEKARKNKGEISKEEMYQMVNQYFGLGTRVSLTVNDKKQLDQAWEKTFSIEAADESGLYDDMDEISTSAMNILNKKAGLGWTSGSHSGIPVPVRVIGPGKELFGTYLDNTDLTPLILQLMQIGQKAETEKSTNK